MVCPRCITAVEKLLKQLDVNVKYIRLGEVLLEKELTKIQLEKFTHALQEIGFELLDNKKTQLIEQVKNLLIQKIQSGNVEEHFSITKFISEKVFKDYSSISKLFSQLEGITLEQFFNLQKIEKVLSHQVWYNRNLHEMVTDR